VVRTYKVTKQRVDQGLAVGNRGFLQGQAPSIDASKRKKTRTTQVIEIELGAPLRSDKIESGTAEGSPTQRMLIEEREGEAAWDNQIIESDVPPSLMEDAPVATFEKYTVRKGDTLQKISKRFFGTSRKWIKIYQANKDVLASPNSIYPGQVIKIPVKSLPVSAEGVPLELK